MTEHLHKLANTGMRRLISCQPGDWSQKDFLNWQQIMQQMLYRKVELPQQKKNTLDKCMQMRRSHFSAAANQYPQEAAPAAVRVVATCVDGMKLHCHNVFMKNHEERK